MMAQSVNPQIDLPARREIEATLADKGWLLINAGDIQVSGFTAFFKPLCEQLTFDPARQSVTDAVQSVDAGTDAVGLHIENGNTPLPPDLVAFFSARSASSGSQTTVCDGAAVYKSLPSQLLKRLEKPYTMTRSLPKVIWQRYVATAENISDAATVTTQQLDAFIHRVPNQSCILNDDGSIRYQLTLSALRSDNYGAIPAFANALLGPSYNYEPPEYRSHDGTLIETALLEDVAELCEQHTEEIDWKDGDIAIIDNKRCLHGRRAITVPLSERSLFIAMGSRRAHSQ